jgi:serine/threonine-protein kinase RsbW
VNHADPSALARLAGAARDTPVRPRRRVFAGQPSQVGQVRRFVRRALATDGAADDAALLASELAANAIQHTATGSGGTFEVIICQCPATVRISVTDAGAATTPALAPTGQLTASGRGLAIVHAVAQRWGHAGDQHGRTVWFELDSPVTAPCACSSADE